jgi:3-phosphoshikimate 1-carboxyvinyltransferase
MDVFFPAETTLEGGIFANPSKSVMQRVLAAVFLGSGQICIQNPSYCHDAQAILKLLIEVGVEVIQMNDEALILNNKGISSVYMVNCGESGLFLRMFAPILGLTQNHAFSMYGEHTLLKRNLQDLEHFLHQIGLETQTQQAYLPIKIYKKPPEKIEKSQYLQFDSLESSQYLTGLLMALPLLPEDIMLEIHHIKSRPYIDLTLELLHYFGIDIQESGKKFKIKGRQHYKLKDITIEGDWSGTAFWIVAGLLKGTVSIAGLNPHSTQADRKILDLLDLLHLPYAFENEVLKIQQVAHIPAFSFDASECPDLFPPLVLLASFALGTSQIKGVHRLKNKETDRAQSMGENLSRLKIPYYIENDTFCITGVARVKGGITKSFGDHRMAMMNALFSLKSEEGIIVEDFYAIEKSYPAFLHHYFQLALTTPPLKIHKD